MQIPERATRSDFPRFDFGLKSRLLLKLQLKLKLIYAACGKAVWGRYRYANMQMSGATTSRKPPPGIRRKRCQTDAGQVEFAAGSSDSRAGSRDNSNAI